MNHKDRVRYLKHATYKNLLTLWRFEPHGSPWFIDGMRQHFYDAFDRERNKLTIQEMMTISKEIGYKGGVARGAYDQKAEIK